VPRVKNPKQELQLLWQQSLSDYVTAITWFPDMNSLLASSAAGEVVLYNSETKQVSSTLLQTATGQSVDCLAISADGEYVAAGGQSGEVNIWQRASEAEFQLVATLKNAPAWVDRMVWNPKQNQLAFSLGRYVQVWDAATAAVVATLNFENSSVLDITWHPDGDRLTVAGYQGIKVWSDWDEDPLFVEIPSASTMIAWSPDGKHIASGNIDRTISVIEWQKPASPWLMRGFPNKIRQLVWSDTALKRGAPLLASSSSQSIVLWEKHPDPAIGWEGQVLGQHEDRVQAMQFQPGTGLLASAGADGWVVLWQKSRIGQTLDGAPNGFSSLSWHPKGHQLAAGGQGGELVVWSKVLRGQGFGK
jgi:WD40 repeat protein